jgi:hypothetical protein
MSKLSDLTKARRLLKLLDVIIDLVEDDSVFEFLPFKEVETIVVNVRRARKATANVLRGMGDAPDSEQTNTRTNRI